MPVGTIIFLLIWPQDDDSVPPGMESLISAPLVKNSEKEEEQVSFWGGPLRTWRVGPYPPGVTGCGGAGAEYSDPQPTTLARTSSCTASASGSSALRPCPAA